ncbi:universal stress protein [Nocardia sp. NPDC052001]|uniref:universal stress protein n=1 Tax=Nocardia sp. NPDC052001 TaxID=3154853 RepID=UPI003417EDFD
MDSNAAHSGTGDRSRTADRQPAVLAGIDGSRAAVRAAVWAAQEAVVRRLPLRLISVVPAIDHPAFRPGGVKYRNAERALTSALSAVSADRRGDPDASFSAVSTEVVHGQPAHLFVELSRSAALIALGAGDIGLFSHMVLGSTALAVARDGHCPVALVRQSTAVNGAVLVVVSEWYRARPALLAGFRAARDHGAELIVARIWRGRQWSSSPESFRARPVVPDAQLAGFQREFPTVTMHPITVVGEAIDAVEKFSATARLVVVGHDADREHTARLGPVTRELVCHAPCPVLVVPDDFVPPHPNSRRDDEPLDSTAATAPGEGWM